MEILKKITIKAVVVEGQGLVINSIYEAKNIAMIIEEYDDEVYNQPISISEEVCLVFNYNTMVWEFHKAGTKVIGLKKKAKKKAAKKKTKAVPRKKTGALVALTNKRNQAYKNMKKQEISENKGIAVKVPSSEWAAKVADLDKKIKAAS